MGLIVLGVALSYLFFSIPRKPELRGGYTTELYALLARNLSRGKTTLPIEPRPELLALPDPYDPNANLPYRLHDASLYKGRYYLYFGPVPVVALFLPYHLVTGRDLTNRVAVPLFCIGGYLCSCALFLLLAAHNRWALPLWLRCAILASLGSMSMACLILRRPSFYEVAIAGGYCFAMAGFLALAWALLTPGATGKRLLLAGLLFGAAVGCRPHLLLVCGVALAAAAWVRRSFKPVAALAIGMVLCGAALGYYNYARFDSPIEFGRTYQLTGSLTDQVTSPASSTFTYSGLHFDARGAVRAAGEFLFLAPRVEAGARFVRTVYINPLAAYPDQSVWKEDTVGLIPLDPLALLGFCLPLVFLKRVKSTGLVDGASASVLFAMYWSCMLVFGILCATGWVLARYLVDFAPLITLAGAALAAVLWRTIQSRRIRRLFGWGIGVAAVCAVAANVALATPRWDQIVEFLRG